MDFEVSIVTTIGETEAREVFEQYHDALKFIEKHMAQWNGFKSEQTLHVFVRKIPSQTPTLGVNVDDEMKLGDIFG